GPPARQTTARPAPARPRLPPLRRRRGPPLQLLGTGPGRAPLHRAAAGPRRSGPSRRVPARAFPSGREAAGNRPAQEAATAAVRPGLRAGNPGRDARRNPFPDALL
ncbi:MAG: hypothetical protein AVDCRST_MAG05-4290, partial [uncultured Rubrobacteraceae bacterium]